MLEPLARLTGAVDRVRPVSGLDDWPRDEPSPDVAVNLHGRGPQSHRLLESLAPRRLIAFATDDAGRAGPRWRPDEHEVVRWCRLLADSLDIPVDSGDLGLALPAASSPSPGAVVVHPGAAHPARRWPPDRFARVAEWARLHGRPVVVTGSPDERPLAQQVAVEAGLGDESVLAGRSSLVELAALLSSALLVVAGDTGVSHLATSYGTPSVTLFGPTPPSLWGPPAGGPHIALWHGSGPGDPWGQTVDPALLAVTVREVVAAADNLLAAASTGSIR